MRLHKNTFQETLEKAELNSPVGTLRVVASTKGLRAILSEEDLLDEEVLSLYKQIPTGSGSILVASILQLKEYFDGKRRSFKLPLDLVGTEFQILAWEVLRTIAYGKTSSYQEQAIKLGSEKKCRAVGGANSKNPIAIVVPCHRVIGKNGNLTGFAGGVAMKRFLLDLERQYSS